MATFPNPFTESMELRFAAPAQAALRLVVFDAAGRRVRGLIDPSRGAVDRIVSWDGRDDSGTPLRAGVYFLQIDGPGIDRSVKVQKLR
jgi:hypothetical protein